MDRGGMEALANAVLKAGLLASDLGRVEMARRQEALAAEHGTSRRTVQRTLAGLRNDGKDTRKTRTDCGSNIILDDPVREERALSIVRTRQKASDKDIVDVFHKRFPEISFSDATGRRTITICQQRLDAKGVHVPLPGEVFLFQLDRAETDFSVADFFVFDPAHNGGRPFRPQLTAVIDSCTRSIMWATYCLHADRETVSQLLRSAILPKADYPERWPQHGTPLSIRADHGKTYRSGHCKEAFSELRIAEDPSRPHTPTDKPHIERVFGSIHRFEALQPGACGHDNKGADAIDPTQVFRQLAGCWVDPRPFAGTQGGRKLLTVDGASALLREWVMDVYHQRDHAGIHIPPLAAWLDGLALMDPDERDRRLSYDLHAFNRLCYLRKTVKVTRGQVRVEGEYYTREDDELSQHEGCKVEVRYAFRDAETVLVYPQRDSIPIECINKDRFAANSGSRADRNALRAAEKAKKAFLKNLPLQTSDEEGEALIAELQRVQRERQLVIAPTGQPRQPLPDYLRGLSLESMREMIAMEGLPGFPAVTRAHCPEELLADYDAIWDPVNAARMALYTPPPAPDAPAEGDADSEPSPAEFTDFPMPEFTFLRDDTPSGDAVEADAPDEGTDEDVLPAAASGGR